MGKLCGVALGIPGRAALKNARSFDDLGHRFFLAVGHDVDAADAADLANGLNQLDADIESFASLILGAAQTRDQRVRKMNAGDALAHPLRRLARAQWADASQD